MTRETTPIRERIRNRTPFRQQTPMRGREVIGYLTLSALIAIPAVFGLWQQNVFVRARFEIEALRREKLQLQERYRCLRIEKATLESLDRIAVEARKVGLVPRAEAAAPVFIAPATGLPANANSRAAAPGRTMDGPAICGLSDTQAVSSGHGRRTDGWREARDLRAETGAGLARDRGWSARAEKTMSLEVLRAPFAPAVRGLADENGDESRSSRPPSPSQLPPRPPGAGRTVTEVRNLHGGKA